MDDLLKIFITICFSLLSVAVTNVLKFFVNDLLIILIIQETLKMVPIFLGKRFLGCLFLGLLSGSVCGIVNEIYNLSEESALFIFSNILTGILLGVGVYPMRKSGTILLFIFPLSMLVLSIIIQWFVVTYSSLIYGFLSTIFYFSI